MSVPVENGANGFTAPQHSPTEPPMNAASRISKPTLSALRTSGEEIPQLDRTQQTAKPQGSSFDARPAAARTSGERHVPLPSLSLGREAGPIALDSAEGQRMVRQAQQVLSSHQGLAAGEGGGA